MSARLYIPPAQLAEGRCKVTGDDFRYLARVLRLAAGDAVTLFDGAGREAAARIEEVGDASLLLTVARAQPVRAPELALTLICGLLKGDKTEWVLQKATELGAHRVVLVSTERTVVRLDGARAHGRLARWRKIVREAARQCGRADVPELIGVLPWSRGLALADPEALRLLFVAYLSAPPLREQLPAEPVTRAALAIGPEGGFTDEEAEEAEAAGFLRASLGKNILRAETAAISALAMVSFALNTQGD